MLPRFHVPDLDPGRTTAALPSDEAHHLTRVLRLHAGDEVAVFDGRGVEFVARVSATGRDSVTVALLRRVEAASSPAVRLVLLQSVLKGDAMDTVVRDATMVGVEVLQPILSANASVKASLLARAGARWNRIAVASAKQCGRARLPEIRPPAPFGEGLDLADAPQRFILLEPARGRGRPLRLRDLAAMPTPRSAALLVGPEGGWTAEEHRTALDAGWAPLTLGPLTLRADAVPITAAAALLALWDAPDDAERSS